MALQTSMTANGIVCRDGSQEIWLDPKNVVAGAVNFVSHAHSDHLPATPANGRGSGHAGSNYGNGSCTDSDNNYNNTHNNNNNNNNNNPAVNPDFPLILSSHQTALIAALRGIQLPEPVEHADGFEMIDSGHILGSRGLLFGETYYTGDICTRDRGFLRGAKIPDCKTLITECTFGLPEFRFPAMRDAAMRANRIISEMYGRGIPVILMGYQLGKAQTLTHLFGHWIPLYLHDSVLEMNALHERLGISLACGMGHTEAESRGLLAKGPWLMITPMLSKKSKLLQDLKSKYGAVTISFSGWAKSGRFAFGKGADYSIPMSDHCDYAELLRMVRQSGAETVYTTHGFAREFASDLRKIGINAAPLVALGSGSGNSTGSSSRGVP